MRVLHICSDFAKQSIYNQLISHLANNKELTQYVFIPTRTAEEVGKYKNDELENVQYYYKHILNGTDRIFYKQKIKKTSGYIMKNVDGSSIDLIHAHFLFSDGGIALEYFKKYNTPYIVAVRNTDINVFFKYMIHLRSTGVEILKNASKIIFLSYAYKIQLLEKYIPHYLREEIEHKSIVIPNGVDPFWLNNISNKAEFQRDYVKVIYVGDFTKNKNIQISIAALKSLKDSGINIQFTIVGGGGDYHDEILKLIKNNSEWVVFIPRTNNKSELLHLFKEADIFCMPSKFETFGIVYIEAMSQGLPLIYTKGQGIDGYFKDGEIGYAVESSNVHEIKNKLGMIIANYYNISVNCSKFAGNFSWNEISSKYIDLYKSIRKDE